REMATDASGAPIPWYTYPAIDFLSQRNFEDKNVLEFGGGQSTLWWQTRARSVLTIEEDANWAERLRPQLRPNVSLLNLPVDLATRSIAPIRTLLEAHPVRAFDVIVVDGQLREETTALAFELLAQRGALILDHSESYEGIFDEIRKRNCRKVDFFGFSPGVSLRHCTPSFLSKTVFSSARKYKFRC